MLAVHDPGRAFDGGGFPGQHENQRAAIGHHAQWLVGGVQHQGVCHDPPSVTWDTLLGQQRCIDATHSPHA